MAPCGVLVKFHFQVWLADCTHGALTHAASCVRQSLALHVKVYLACDNLPRESGACKDSGMLDTAAGAMPGLGRWRASGTTLCCT